MPHLEAAGAMPPPAVGDGRRGSFTQFAVGKIFQDKSEEEEPKSAPAAEEVRRQNGSWERHIHSAALLGYSFQQSFVVLLWLIFIATLDWSILNEAGVRVLNHWGVELRRILEMSGCEASSG